MFWRSKQNVLAFKTKCFSVQNKMFCYWKTKCFVIGKQNVCALGFRFWVVLTNSAKRFRNVLQMSPDFAEFLIFFILACRAATFTF
jgi:hypothetical protein